MSLVCLSCVLSCSSYVRLFAPHWTVAHQAPLWNSSGKNTGMGCQALLQGIFPTQGSNPHLIMSPALQVGSLPLVPPGKPWCVCQYQFLHSQRYAVNFVSCSYPWIPNVFEKWDILSKCHIYASQVLLKAKSLFNAYGFSESQFSPLGH